MPRMIRERERERRLAYECETSESIFACEMRKRRPKFSYLLVKDKVIRQPNVVQDFHVKKKKKKKKKTFLRFFDI